MLSDIVVLAKPLLSNYAASWAKQALYNSFLYKCFKLHAFPNFQILSRCLETGSQALYVDTDYCKCCFGINLYPVNKIC